MGNIATNTNQQIAILKERGMVLDLGEDKVKEVLHDIGYYRLGFYWNPFQKQPSSGHEFIEGTLFSNVLDLYYFDVDLRNLLLKYVKRIEVNFRTNVVYYTSNAHKNSPTWFADSNVVSNKFVESLEVHYNSEFRKNNKAINLHHKKYINDKYAPAWKTLEFFSFGAILNLFRSLKNENVKERISKKYDIINVKKFENLMNSLVFIRNACAHSKVLFDIKTPLGISAIPQIDFNNSRHSLDSLIKVILHFLEHISVTRKGELELEIEKVFNRHLNNSVLKTVIEQGTGYKY